MISSLVAILDRDAERHKDVLRELGILDSVELGEMTDNRLPVVIEAGNPAEMEFLTDKIRDLPGVLHIDVAFVSLE